MPHEIDDPAPRGKPADHLLPVSGLTHRSLLYVGFGLVCPEQDVPGFIRKQPPVIGYRFGIFDHVDLSTGFLNPPAALHCQMPAVNPGAETIEHTGNTRFVAECEKIV